MPVSIPRYELMFTNAREEQLHIHTGIISICECTERKAFLVMASGGESVNRAKAPIAEDLTLNLYRQEDSLFPVWVEESR